MSSTTGDLSQTASSNLTPKTTRAKTLLFASTLFLSAFLLFQMQLIVSKCILPWFGGSAAVWTTSLLVFQVLLLGGYIYSHVISARLSAMAQTRIHIALLSIAFLTVFTLSFLWPSALTPGASWKPVGAGYPTLDVVVIILVSAGLPFFAFSTTGPLLQRWFARLGGGSGTYRLYSISNLGSLLGLLTFPFVLEPTLRLKTQGRFWSLLFCGFIAGCGVCAWKARNTTEETRTTENMAGAPAETQTGVLTYVLWFLLAACPSSLLLATTNLLCQEVMSIPLLWVLPLSLYLLSFILCFDNPRWYRRSIFHSLFGISLFLTCAAVILVDMQIQAILLPALLFFGCMICHGELVRLKPGVKRLTSFYLTISAGGAAGGIFVGIVAPHLFTFFTEFQLTLGFMVVLLLVCLFLHPASWIFERGSWLPAAITGGTVLAAYLGGLWLPGVPGLLETLHFYPCALSIGAVVVLSTYLLGRGQGSGRRPREKRRGKPETQRMKRRPLEAGPANERGFRFVQVYVVCIAVLALAALYRSTLESPEPFLSLRNFYGAVRVYRQPRSKHRPGSMRLMHGQTLHGAQLDPPNNKVPITYYGKKSGIGIVLQNHSKRSIPGESLRVGLVGLGAGTLAAYGRPGDYFRFYEINPEVVKLSSGPQPVFTYLRDSAARVDVELGDARLLLEQELAKGQVQKFDVLVLDAFSGDAIPVHLLTREAFETYWQHLDPDHGIIAVHVSSRHIDLFPVLQGAIAYFHADSVVDFDTGEDPFDSNTWVLIARHPGALNIRGLDPTPLPRQSSPRDGDQVHTRVQVQIRPRLWTDDYSDIFQLIR